jgi:ATP-dependent exoDNAse (exonuclease V) beta subunit
MSRDACSRADLERCAKWLTVENAELRGVVPEALGLIEGVRASAMWQQAQTAEERHVEVPFAVTQPGADGRPIVVNGVIDLALKTADGWCIVDHKTDQLTSPDGRELVEKYAVQLNGYAEAWKKILPTARVTTGLHAVRTGTVHWR